MTVDMACPTSPISPISPKSYPRTVPHRRLSNLGNGMVNLAKRNMYHDSIITCVLYLENPLSAEALRELAERTLACEWRFCSNISTLPTGENVWDIHTNTPDMTYHIKEITIPTTKEQADQKDLNNYLGQFFGQIMDNTRPMWQLLSVTNLKNGGPEGDAQGAVILRIHHTIGDGISLANLMMRIWDTKPVFKSSPPSAKASIWPEMPAALDLCHDVRNFVVGILDGLLFPVLPADTETILKHPDIVHLGSRQVATSPSIDLAVVKDIKNALGVTINDVLMAALAGTLSRYMAKKGASKVDPQIRTMCLINMRPANRRYEMVQNIKLENRWNFLPIVLPMCQSDVLERLYIAHRRCLDAKNSPSAAVAYTVNQLAGKVLSEEAYCEATYSAFNKCTTVFSNVQGPPEEVSLLGQKVKNLVFYANSLTGTVFGLVSYNNKVGLSVVADTSLVEDPQELVDLFVEEVKAQHQAVQGDFRKPTIQKR
eukprot:Ihof_evm8s59 gene=Ihof_evmTU8s59